MKKIRNIAIALCLVMCSIVLVACGGTGSIDKEASISKKGYVSTTKEDYNQYMGETLNATSASFKSYKLTTKTEYKSGDLSLNMTANCIVTIDDNDKITGLALKYKLGEKTEISMYLKDDYAYLYHKNENTEHKYMTKMVSDETSNTLGSIEIPLESSDVAIEKDEDMFEDYHNIADYFESFFSKINSIKNDTDVKFEKAVKGNNKRFHINATNTSSTNNFYLEFENDKLVGIEMQNTIKDVSETKLALVKFDGKIKYPSFKNYEEVSENTISKIFDAVNLF